MKTKSFPTLCILFLLILHLSVSGQWSQLNSWTTCNFESICFTDANTAYCVGRNSNYYYGSVFKTIDGGASWDSLHLDIGYPTTIVFPSQNTGYLGAYDRVFKTRDAGETWSEYGFHNGYMINDLVFLDTLRGYVVGYEPSMTWKIVAKTLDGNNTWTDITPNVWYGEIKCIDCANDSSCIFGIIDFPESASMITLDGGISWQDITPDGTSDVYSVCYLDANHAFLGGLAENGDSRISMTTDGGQTWITLFSSPDYPVPNDIYFINTDTGYFVTDGGHILKTTDGGTNWTEQPSGVASRLSSIFFLSDNHGYIAGYNGVILQKGGSFVIEDFPEQSKGNAYIYPNPLTSSYANLVITETLAPRDAQIKFYNLYGKEILSVKGINLHETRIEMDDLTSGVYFYLLTEHGKFIDSGKMIIEQLSVGL